MGAGGLTTVDHVVGYGVRCYVILHNQRGSALFMFLRVWWPDSLLTSLLVTSSGGLLPSLWGVGCPAAS